MTHQKLGNLQSQTGNFVAQQSWMRKLLNACLTLALQSCHYFIFGIGYVNGDFLYMSLKLHIKSVLEL